MKGFVRIANGIFDYELSSSELLVFCYMSSKKNMLSALTIRHETIAKALELSRNTVVTALGGLTAKGLVFKQKRYHHGYQVSNRYFLAHIPGQWFKLPRFVFSLKLNKSDFAVYLYILRCSNAKCHAWPSAHRIANGRKDSKGCGVSKPRIRQAIKTLTALSLIRKERVTKDCGAFGCNHFQIIGHTLRETLLSLYRKSKKQSIATKLWAAYISLCTQLATPILVPVNLSATLLGAKKGKHIFLRI